MWEVLLAYQWLPSSQDRWCDLCLTRWRSNGGGGLSIWSSWKCAQRGRMIIASLTIRHVATKARAATSRIGEVWDRRWSHLLCPLTQSMRTIHASNCKKKNKNCQPADMTSAEKRNCENDVNEYCSWFNDGSPRFLYVILFAHACHGMQFHAWRDREKNYAKIGEPHLDQMILWGWGCAKN